MCVMVLIVGFHWAFPQLALVLAQFIPRFGAGVVLGAGAFFFVLLISADEESKTRVHGRPKWRRRIWSIWFPEFRGIIA